MSSDDTESRLTHEAFAALGNALRMEILQVLWTDGELRFNELYHRVDVGDTGQFSYHLDRLRDHFVAASDDGYRLTNAGREIVTTILAHTEGSNPFDPPVTMDVGCHACSEALEAAGAGGWLRVDCSACGKLYASFPVPSAGVHGRAPDEILKVFDHRLRRQYGLVHRESCPNCSCRMMRTVVPDAEPEPGLPLVFHHVCSHCRLEVYSPPGIGLLEDPAVIAHYHDAGVNPYTIPHWEFDWLFDGRSIEVVDEDPLVYEIEVAVDGVAIPVSLDADGRITGHDEPAHGMES